jgi:hypothetical protein
MTPPPASFAFLIETAQIIVAAVNTRDNLHLRPEVARKAVAVRLASGLRLLRAFLRRLIILMAVELEWTLVDTRGPMKRPHGCPSKPTLASFSIKGLDAPIASPWLDGYGPEFKPVVRTGRVGPVDVDMSQLYAQLKFLSRIAANPMAKAHLRRHHHSARRTQAHRRAVGHPSQRLLRRHALLHHHPKPQQATTASATAQHMAQRHRSLTL